MKSNFLLFLCFFICGFIGKVHPEVNVEEPPPVPEQNEQLHKEEEKLSQYILRILDHYKQKDPVGVPGLPIPDPLPIPPFSRHLSVGTLKMKDVKCYGLKKFRIQYINMDLAKMKVEAALTIDTLHVLGNYTLSTFLSTAKGPFTANLTNIYVKAEANMEVERSGQLEAQEIAMDITLKDIKLNFEGLGFFAGLLQGIMNTVGSFVFESIKPFILSEVNTNLRKDINNEAKKVPMKFPNSISPLDQLIAEARRRVRNMGYDPYKVNDYNNSVGVFDVYLTHTWLYGASSFHRTKDIILQVKNKTVHMLIEVGTQKLLGTSNWEVALISGFLARGGTVKFSVEYIRVQIAVSQTMDTRNPPNLDDIQLELGNIQVRFDGLGTIDYLIEFGVNVLPNLLRYQIMDALERPVKMRIQEALNQVNVENLIKENSDKLDNYRGLDFLNKI